MLNTILTERRIDLAYNRVALQGIIQWDETKYALCRSGVQHFRDTSVSGGFL
jgi:hypothetical protein